MSMMAELRLVSPRVLEILRQDPSLVDAALRTGLPTLPGQDDLPLPASVAKLLASLPPAERARMESQMAQQMAALRDSPQVSGLFDEREDDLEEGRVELERLGVTAEDLGPPLGIDKAWHGVHFLLTGSSTDTTPPLGAAILGGQELGEDLGYGPARYLSPAEVAAVADALAPLTADDLAQRYDPSAMERQKIYPGHWHEPDSEDWLLETFDEVKAYYAQARERGYGMLLSMG